MITALSGGIFTRGQTTTPLSIAAAPTALNQVLVLNGFGTAADERARRTVDGRSCATIDAITALVAGREPDDAAGGRHRADPEQRRDAGHRVSEHDARATS